MQLKEFSKMNIEELKSEYLSLTKTCAEIDYFNKHSIRKNSLAVDRMYKIMNLLSKNNSKTEILKFAELLDITKNKTNLWLATQMLEKLNLDKTTQKQALKIIKKAAKGNGADALGYKSWLADYKEKY